MNANKMKALTIAQAAHVKAVELADAGEITAAGYALAARSAARQLIESGPDELNTTAELVVDYLEAAAAAVGHGPAARRLNSLAAVTRRHFIKSNEEQE